MTVATKFIHFGCWNYGECSGNTPVAQVTTAVNQAIHEHHVDYIIVAGDNYYPIKNKNIDLANGATEEEKVAPKLVNPAMLQSGFACLPTEIPTYILWGNHDLDNSSSLRLYEGTVEQMQTLSNAEDLRQPEPCQIMDLELSHPSSNLIFPLTDRFVNFRKDGNAFILMIDTTMYDISKKDKNDNRTCYNKYYGSFELDILRERQNASILDILTHHVLPDDSIQHLILVGHHPLLYPKLKDDKGKKKIKSMYLEHMIPMLVNIHALFRDRTMQYVYLCADYHNYQEGIVRIGDMQIKQYIVGTGGTKLDAPLDRDMGTIMMSDTEYPTEYQFQKEINAYGYLMCTLISTPVFEFVMVAGPTGGYRKRTRRKRTRRKRRLSSKMY
jgi:hypothetical protein